MLFSILFFLNCKYFSLFSHHWWNVFPFNLSSVLDRGQPQTCNSRDACGSLEAGRTYCGITYTRFMLMEHLWVKIRSFWTQGKDPLQGQPNEITLHGKHWKYLCYLYAWFKSSDLIVDEFQQSTSQRMPLKLTKLILFYICGIQMRIFLKTLSFKRKKWNYRFSFIVE